VFAHVSLRVQDRAASERFYRTVLSTLGHEPTHERPDVIAWDDFALIEATDSQPPTHNLHVGFVAPSREHVHDFHRAGLEAGYRDDGPPGERPQYGDDYYGAFLRDPDGNSAEAVHHGDTRRGGCIDHLWIRVSDLESAHAFYLLIRRHTGLRPGNTWPGGRQLRGAWATFALIHDEQPPTENLHMAFPAPDRQTVRDFYAAAINAGYRSHGEPGERPHYGEGYYAAYVLDPDGNNIESVARGPG
jgi:catechol 2,3-dioxygenase-like lactoylglutathione lyase family enzyme